MAVYLDVKATGKLNRMTIVNRLVLGHLFFHLPPPQPNLLCCVDVEPPASVRIRVSVPFPKRQKSLFWSSKNNNNHDDGFDGHGGDCGRSKISAVNMRRFIRIKLLHTLELLPVLLFFVLMNYIESSSVQGKLLVRKIQSKPDDIHHALKILDEEQTQFNNNNNKRDDGPYLAALRVCGKINNPDIAVQIYNKNPSPACETMVISVLGYCNQYQRAVDLLLKNHQSRAQKKQAAAAATTTTTTTAVKTSTTDATYTTSTGSFNAALAACGKSKDWKLALDIYDNHMPTNQISTLTSNIVLDILSNCRQGSEAMNVLNTMPCQPDRVSYQYVFSALIRSYMADDATQLLSQLRHQQSHKNPNDGNHIFQPSDDIYDLVIAAHGKVGNWDAIQTIERIRYPNTTKTTEIDDVREKYSFQYVDKLTKIGKGKESSREVATYLPFNITIGVHPNRNPAKNGIKLVFYQNSNVGVNIDEEAPPGAAATIRRMKLGYLLMINSNNSSSLMGMYLNTQERGKGIAKICLATWLWFCLQAGIRPKTGVMNKPLISLLLQHKFGFIPSRKKGRGVQVEVSSDPDYPDKTIVYASSYQKSLEGALCPRDLQHQNIKISLTPPNPRGRIVNIKTILEAPSDPTLLQELVAGILPDDAIACHLSPSDIRIMYLGK